VIDAVDDGPHRRIVAQELRIVGVLVTSCDLVDPLPHQIEHRVADVAPIAPVRDQLREPAGECESFVELAQHHQPRIARDLAALEIDDEFPLESEPRSTMTLCSHRHPSSFAADVSLVAASIADSESVGGFFTDALCE
jgi:hypothetical protein